jgi:hypothetical protein
VGLHASSSDVSDNRIYLKRCSWNREILLYEHHI